MQGNRAKRKGERMGSYRVIGDWKIIEQGNTCRWWRIGDDIEERLESLPKRTLLRGGDLKKKLKKSYNI